MKNDRGFTLVELLVVIALIGIITTLASLNWNQMSTKVAIESEAKIMHADLMEVRMQALYTKKQRRVGISGQQFKIYSSAVETPTPQLTKNLKYPVVWSGAATSVVFDTHGLRVGNVDENDTICILPTNDTSVVYAAAVDSIIISQARINLGKRTGGGCSSGNIDQK
jgi:type IV fimbrial biogenesis protein FimT